MDTAGEIEAERRRIVRLKWKKWSQHILLYTFAKENPTLNAALQARNRKLDIPRMIKNIPNGTAMIEYSFVSAVPPGLIFLVITNVGIQQALWTNCDLKRIQRHILDLRQCMWSPHENVRDNSTSQLESGSTGPRTATEQLQKALYTDLVAPIERRLSSLSRLIIIPSGDLAHVPWTMFFNIPFTVVPSLSIWDRLHASTNDISKASSKISVVSNSPYDEAGFLRDIPYSRMEAFYVADIHDHQKPFLADKHNRPEFQQQAETAHILHLCAHSSFNDKDPMGSSIQLFKNSLTIKGWHELKIRPELVIFSSCLSGISKAFDSGSTFGFAHTLLATGTRAFIGSLWPVDDAATLILMMLFYKELRKSLSPSEALYSAQRQMREMDQDGLFELTSELKALFPPGGDGHQDYVFPAKHYLRVLQELSVEGLKKPRCWAAFVLTGYGCKPLY